MEVTAYSSPHRTEDTGNLTGTSFIFFRFAIRLYEGNPLSDFQTFSPPALAD